MHYPMVCLLNNLESVLPLIFIKFACIMYSSIRMNNYRIRCFLRFLAISIHFNTSSTSNVFDNVHAIIFLEYRSITLVRYTNPSKVNIYVISVHHASFGLLGEKSLFKMLCSFVEKSLSKVVLHMV